MESTPASTQVSSSGSGAGLKLLAVFLGLAVGVMIPLGIWLAAERVRSRGLPSARGEEGLDSKGVHALRMSDSRVLPR